MNDKTKQLLILSVALVILILGVTVTVKSCLIERSKIEATNLEKE